MTQLTGKFQIWKYVESRQQLCIRRLVNVKPAHNIDICFVAVGYFELPDMMHGIEIAAPTAEEQRKAYELSDNAAWKRNVYILISGGRRFMVVAGNMYIEENELGFDQTSIDPT